MNTVQATPVFGLVLTGGHSTRMGQDKAALLYDREPQLARAVNVLQQVCAQVFVSMRADQRDALREQWPVIVDGHQDIGPIAGIASAQGAHPTVAWLAIACDMPRLDQATLQQLLHAREHATEADVIAFTMPGSLLAEPLCTLWLPSSCVLVSAAIARGERSPQRILQGLNTVLLTPDNPAALTNINTLDEYRMATAS